MLAAGDIDAVAVDVLVETLTVSATASSAGDRVAFAAPDGGAVTSRRTHRAASADILENDHWIDFAEEHTDRETPLPDMGSGGGQTFVGVTDSSLDAEDVVASVLIWLGAELKDSPSDGMFYDVECFIGDRDSLHVPARLATRFPVLPAGADSVAPGPGAAAALREAGTLPPDEQTAADYDLMYWDSEQTQGIFDGVPAATGLVRVLQGQSDIRVQGADEEYWGRYVVLVTVVLGTEGRRGRRTQVVVQTRPGVEAELTTLIDVLSSEEAGAAWPGGDETSAVADATARLLSVEPAKPALVRLGAAEKSLLQSRFGDIADVLPLSPLQEGFFYHLQMANEAGTTDLYASQSRGRVRGDLDVARMSRAVDLLLARNENLKAGFVTIGDRSVQVIPDTVPTPVRVIRVADINDDVEVILAQERCAEFSADRPPLLRFLFLEEARGEWILALTFEHLIFDGWSLGLVWDDLFALYDEIGARSLPERTPYRDYVQWLTTREDAAAESAWRDYFGGDTGSGRVDPTIVAPEAEGIVADAGAARDVYRHLDPELHTRIIASCREAGVTVGTFLHVAWGIVLGRLLNRSDAVFGSTVSGRPPELAGSETIIGLLFNTVPVHVQANRADSIRELLTGHHARSARVLDAFHLKLTDIQRIAGAPRLFDTLCIIRNMPFATAGSGRLFGPADAQIRVVADELDDSTHYPLSVAIFPGEQIEVRCSYRGDIYSQDEVEAIVDRLVLVLTAMASDLDASVGQISVTTPDDFQRFHEWNATARTVEDTTIAQLLQEQAHRTPAETAVVAGDVRLSFDDLTRAAGRYAAVLIRRGVRVEDRVALLLPRDERTIVALFGVFFAGAAYVPIDPEYPDERIEYILDAAAPKVVLTTADHVARVPVRSGYSVVSLDADAIRTEIDSPNAVSVDPVPVMQDNLAYVIFTSGSTGRPKGVAVGQRGLTNMYFNHERKIFDPVVRHQGGRRMKIAHTTSFSFDASWEQLFWLLNGHEVHVIDEQMRKDPQLLLDHYDSERIDGFDVTPSYGQILTEDGLLNRPRPAGMSTDDTEPGVVFVSLGGEAVPESLWTELREAPGVESFNLYGPTEYTINALGADLGESATSNAGRPIDNTRAYVLDANLAPTPPGTAGELYLAGAGLARGYFARASLTSERFVADPFDNGQRLYRTGDLVRWRSDGQIDYLGRTDDQIKIRGFRVELNEIAETLRGHPGINAAVVIAADKGSGGVRTDVQLAAYYTGYTPLPDSALRTSLALTLPAYMIPATFTHLDALPLTTNGKVDLAALPEPAPRSDQGALRAPATDNELRLRSIVADVIGAADDLDSVDIDANFVDVGVDSLRLTRLASRINAEFDLGLTLRSLIENPSVAELAAIMDEPVADIHTGRLRVTRVTRPEVIPASYGQQSLWLMDQVQGPSDQYIVPLVIPLAGVVDVSALVPALGDVIARHEPLRTRLMPDEHVVVRQQIDEALQASDRLGVERVDGRGWDRSRIDARLRESMLVPFELSLDLPVRCVVVDTDRGCVLGISVHHSAFDEWSAPILLRELSVAYQARQKDAIPDWDPLPVEYADYAVWQRTLLGDASDTSSLLHAGLEYWVRTLDGAPDRSGIPADVQGPESSAWTGHWRVDVITGTTARRLFESARTSGVSMFMLSQAAVAVAVAAAGGGDDLIIGTPVGGRMDEELEQLVGYFVNTLPLRHDLSGLPTLGEVLGRARSTVLAGFEHQDVPFEEIARAVGRRSGAHASIFHTMVTYREEPGAPSEFAPGISLDESAPITLATLKSAVELYITVTDDRVVITGGYATELYSPAAVDRFVVLLTKVFEAFATDTDLRLSELDLITDGDRKLLERCTHGRSVPLELPSHPRTLVDLLRYADRDTAAVACGDRSISAGELDSRTMALASDLVSRGAGPGAIVAVALPRGIELVVALHAVVRSGAAYLPLDLTYPSDRLSFMVTDSDPVLVVTDRESAAVVPAPRERLLFVEDARGTGDVELPVVEPRSPAYLIYTSGSTGRPKGVLVPHDAIVNRLVWMQEAYGLTAADKVLQKTPASFDVSVWEFFWPLVHGASIEVALPGRHGDPGYLAALIRDSGVTTVHFVPSMLDAFLADPGATTCRGLRRVICSGEALPVSTARRFAEVLPGVRLDNLYGPTEAAVDVTWCEDVQTADVCATSVPIGMPVWNTGVHVLDEYLRPVSVGAVGELYLSGRQLALGYFGRFDLTAGRFVAADSGERYYRTGDRVAWNEAGYLEFRGRVDDQVKLRGFRIEPGEIAAALTRAGADSAAVLVHGDVLVGYVTGIDGPTVRAAVAADLPAHMVPQVVMTLPSMPVTANGKLDRRALPAPELRSGTRDLTTDTERAVADAVTSVLGVTGVGADADFFVLGGHSLSAIRLVNRIQGSLGVKVPLRAVFDGPTVAEIAAAVETSGAGVEGPDLTHVVRRPEDIPLSFAQQRMWVLYQVEGPSPTYNVPLVWTPPAEGLDIEALRAAIGDVVRRHATLRTVFPSIDGRGVQRVESPDVQVPFEHRRIERSELEVSAAAAMRHAFGLDSEIPIRVSVFDFDGDQLVLLVIHHIATDEWSLGPLTKDLSSAYEARCNARVPDFSSLPIDYVDYTLWERGRIGDRDDPAGLGARQLSFWSDTLAGAPAEMRLPQDRPRPAQISYRGASVPAGLDARRARLLQAVAERHQISVFMLVHAAVAIALQRSGAGADVVLGTPISGRRDERLEDLVGFFLNTVVLRVDLSGDPSIGEVFKRVRTADLAAFDNQDVPFEHVVDAVGTRRTMSMHPLFQVMVVYIGAAGGATAATEHTGCAQIDLASGTGTAKFDLSFDFAEDRSGAMTGVVEYATDLFDERTVTAIVDRLHRVFDAMIDHADRSIGGIDVLGPERALVARPPVPASVDAAVPLTIPALFAQRVQIDPHAVAVIDGDAAWTFAELDGRVRRVAARLREMGVGNEALVAVCLPRGADYVAAVFGVLTAGAAYLPVDPALPATRINAMVDDARPAVALVDNSTRAGMPADVPHLGVRDMFADNDPGTIDAPLHPDNRAYVVFTSGTTGRPKGVTVSHRGLATLYHSHRRMLHDTVVDRTGRDHLRVGHAWAFSFDASWQPLLWILGGHAIDIVDEDTQRDPDLLLDRLREQRWDFLELTPSYVAQLLDRGLGTHVPIAMVGFGGEAVSASLWSRLRSLPATEAVNLYGPTESTVDAMVASVADSDQPVIGRPVDGSTGYVLDERLRAVPVGVEGDLYLAGAGLARGYLDRPALTSERFVADPIGGGRMYRTGDRARWTFDGLLDYRGRSDNQVKVRGFRIEPGEIESVVKTLDGVVDAVVVPHETDFGTTQLVAYVVIDKHVDVRADTMRVLPDYMVPAVVVELDRLPLLSNGKLDRSALPGPAEATGGAEPSTDVERTLCTAVADVLGLPSVGADSDFFELGGDSIVAMQLVSAARVRGLKISPKHVFACRTVIELATVAEQVTGSGPADIATGSCSLTPVMHWLRDVDTVAPGTTDGYNQVVTLRTPADFDPNTLVDALAAVADRHDLLRARLCVDGPDRSLTIPDSVDVSSWLDRRVFTGDWAGDLEDAALHARSRLDPKAGAMVVAAWLDAGPVRSGRLILMAHHLVMDGVSWRILVPDLLAAYRRLSDGDEVVLPARGTAFRTWSALLADLAVTRTDERLIWEDMVRDADPLPLCRPLDPSIDVVSTVATTMNESEAEITQHVLGEAPKTYGVGVGDLMTAALSAAFAHWRRLVSDVPESLVTSTVIDLEHHGREEELGDVDLSRTIGWFTAIHPLRLESSAAEYTAIIGGDRTAAMSLVNRVRGRMDTIADNGIGYGMLRHLHPERPLAGIPQSAVEFNYLGRFTELQEGDWSFAEDGAAADVGPNPDMPAGHALEINVRTLDTAGGPKIYSSWRYPVGVVAADDVRVLADAWHRALTAIAKAGL